MYSNIVSGGEVHTATLAASAIAAGYPVHFFTGTAFRDELARRSLPVTLTVTDNGVMASRDFSALSGQLALFGDYWRRLRGSLRQLSDIQPDDILYSSTEFWWDSIPAMRSRARRKIMYVGMDAPTLRQIVFKSRPDVKGIRLPSLHFWLSQHLAVQWFRRVREKKLIYSHTNQRQRLLRMGYNEDDLVFVSNGVDLHRPAAVPSQEKIYDVAWVGRVHKQKGIEDLLATLVFLANEINEFRAILIGDLKTSLEPRIAELGLGGKVMFSGYVPEAEKFRLLKSSHVFLMPSKYESWGIVIGEALAAGLPVVAYRLDAYPSVFGNLLRYVDPFDLETFRRSAADEVRRCRSGEKRVDEAALARFVQENSWETVGERFLTAVRSLEA